MDSVMLIVDGCFGVYVPKRFAEKYGNTSALLGIMQEDLDVLLAGPDAENYWDCWDEVLAKARLKFDNSSVEYYLYQDGDLFAIDCEAELPDDWV
jgi:hypothetical protein